MNENSAVEPYEKGTDCMEEDLSGISHNHEESSEDADVDDGSQEPEMELKPEKPRKQRKVDADNEVSQVPDEKPCDKEETNDDSVRNDPPLKLISYIPVEDLLVLSTNFYIFFSVGVLSVSDSYCNRDYYSLSFKHLPWQDNKTFHGCIINIYV